MRRRVRTSLVAEVSFCSCSRRYLLLQVVKNAKQTQARKASKAGGYADDDSKPAEEPKRWSDYTVSRLHSKPQPHCPPLTGAMPGPSCLALNLRGRLHSVELLRPLLRGPICGATNDLGFSLHAG